MKKYLRSRVREVEPGRYAGVGASETERTINALNFLAPLFDAGDEGREMHYGRPMFEPNGEIRRTSYIRRREGQDQEA